MLSCRPTDWPTTQPASQPASQQLQSLKSCVLNVLSHKKSRIKEDWVCKTMHVTGCLCCVVVLQGMVSKVTTVWSFCQTYTYSGWTVISDIGICIFCAMGGTYERGCEVNRRAPPGKILPYILRSSIWTIRQQHQEVKLKVLWQTAFLVTITWRNLRVYYHTAKQCQVLFPLN